MKHFRPLPGQLALALAATLALAAAGCSRSYIITTNTGHKVVTATKPRLVQSKYVYKDANGRTNEISTLRVRSVEPYSKEAMGSPLKIPELR